MRLGWLTLLFATISFLAFAQDAGSPDDIVVTGKRYQSPGIYIDNLGSNLVTVNLDGLVQFLKDGSIPLTSQHQCAQKNAKREAGADQAAKNF